MAAFGNVEMELSGHVKGIGTIPLGTVLIPVNAEDKGGGKVTLSIDTPEIFRKMQEAFR